MTKEKVTLVPDIFSEKGCKYIQVGKTETCDNCKVKNACIENTEEGRIYKITNIRNKTHKCDVTGNEMRVVEVKEPSLKLVTEIHNEFVGSVKTFHSPNCDIKDCRYREFCKTPPGIKEGDLLEIGEILKKIECKKGKRMFTILAKRRS